jgi:hypothetical protein
MSFGVSLDIFLNGIAARVFDRRGSLIRSHCGLGFPHVLISVNDKIVHGVPGAQRLKRADLVKLDVTAPSASSQAQPDVAAKQRCSSS